MSDKTKKILRITGNAVIWLFVVFAIVMTVLALAAQSSPDGVPSIGGKVYLTVSSDSMEPTFKKGDLIIGKTLSPEERSSLQKGDVITFWADLDGNGYTELNTHRIVEVTNENGIYYYQTKGDNETTNPVPDKDLVNYGDVVCKWTEKRIAGIGSFIAFLQQPKGFLIVIVLPLILFFLYELYVFIRTLLEVKNSGKKQITAADEELIKQRAVEEYLRQQAQTAEKDTERSTDSDGGDKNA